jgi:hypothetical protein
VRLTTIAVFAAALSFSAVSFAGDKERDRREDRREDWKEDHPRRAEVNKRLNNQAQRVDEGVATGKLTTGQARELHAEDHAVRQQERAMAAEHDGHITKGEQNKLNREENRISDQIHDEKHPNQP